MPRPLGVLLPNSGVEKDKSNLEKAKFEKTCLCPRGLVTGKYLQELLGQAPKDRAILGGGKESANYRQWSDFTSSSPLGEGLPEF